MTKPITITLTEDAISIINQFMDAGIDNCEDHLSNWATNDGYSQEDIESSRKDVEKAKQVMASINAALEKSLAANQPDNDDLPCLKPHPEIISEESIFQDWVLYSANEAATMGGRGFWSLEGLWCQAEDASFFTAAQVGTYNLPMSLGQDRCWINYELAQISSEAGLSEALSVFCRTQNLPEHAPETLLAQDGLEPFQSIWLKQLIRQREGATKE